MSEKKQFWGATFFTATHSGVKLLINYILGKVAAITLGPAGLGLLGQFQSLALIVQNFSNGAIHNGIIKGLAIADSDAEKRNVVKTAFTISVVLGLFCGIIVLCLAPALGNYFLSSNNYRVALYVLAGCSVFFSLNVLFSSVFNGFKDYRSITVFNIIQSICNLVLFVPMTKYWGINGALISVVLFQALAFVIGYLLFRKKYNDIFKMLTIGIDKKIARQLAEYSLMTLFTVTTFSTSQLLIRSHLIKVNSIDAAGLWEGLNRISNFYLYFIAFLITAYVLPRYAEEKDYSKLKSQLSFNLTRMAGLSFLIIAAVFILRKILIRIVFSPKFIVLEDVMFWHLAGDLLKIACWIFSNFLVARKYTRAFLITDFIFHALFTFCVYQFCTNLSMVTQAYAFSALIYLVIIIPLSYFLLQKEFRHEKN